VGPPRAESAELAVIAGSPAKPAAVIAVPVAGGSVRVLRESRPATIDPGYISVPRAIEFPTTGNRTAFGYFYPPRNRDFAAPGTAT